MSCSDFETFFKFLNSVHRRNNFAKSKYLIGYRFKKQFYWTIKITMEKTQA